MQADPAFSLRSYGAQALSHSHAHHQLILPVTGRLELETAAGGGCVDHGQGAAVAGGVRHAFRACGRNRFAVIDWPISLYGELDGLWDTLRSQPYFTLDPALHHALQFMLLESGHDGAGAVFARRWTGLLLLALRDRLTRQVPLSPRLAAALDYVRRRFREPIRPGDIAAAVNLSTGRLHALFRAGVGCTPMAYVRQLRLEEAARLLACSTLPLAAVAQAAGFADQSALTRSFRRDRGMAPGRYRRRCTTAQDKNA